MRKINFIYVIYLALLIFTLSSFVVHEYYVTICSIDYNKSDRQLETTLKFIAHDLEKVILEENLINLNIGEDNQHPKIDSIINAYVLTNFSMVINGIPQSLTLLGTEFNLDETLYVYYLTNQNEIPQQIELKNTLLISIFPNQENLTHINFWEKQKSYSFNRINIQHTFKSNE